MKAKSRTDFLAPAESQNSILDNDDTCLSGWMT
jgi:hypothetical protein